MGDWSEGKVVGLAGSGGSAADADGMMVSMIQSNFRGMGSGLVGFCLRNGTGGRVQGTNLHVAGYLRGEIIKLATGSGAS